MTVPGGICFETSNKRTFPQFNLGVPLAAVVIVCDHVDFGFNFE
jgi:hypothetical protein